MPGDLVKKIDHQYLLTIDKLFRCTMFVMNDNLASIRSGFVAVMGRPNVGKSTLINALLGQKVAAVSPRPQTTRKRQMGILTLDEPGRVAQIVFVDTPGLHRPRHKLGELMNRDAVQTLEESDLILFVADASQPPNEEDHLLFELLSGLKRPAATILALNKLDAVSVESFETHSAAFVQGVPTAHAIPISATRGDHLTDLLEAILERLPEGPPFFPEDQLTDLYEREIAADLIREASLILLRDEIPHGIAVRIDQYTERGEEGVYIEATLFVERETHKPIIIGKEGQMLKRIGISARQEIEKMSGRKVYLQLKVKVRKNWRDDEKTLKSFGY
jgi:GTPase